MTVRIAAQQRWKSIHLLLEIWQHLSQRRHLQLGALFLVMLVSGLAELVSLGAVVPFLAVLSNPQRYWQQPLVQTLSTKLGFTEASQLILPVTVAFAAAAVSASLIRMTNLWLNGKMAASVGSDLSCEAYRRTLYQPYSVHVQRNSAAVITAITTQIAQTVGGFNAFLQLVTSTVVASGLFVGLLLIDASVAVAAAVLFGTAYAILANITSRELRSNSHKISEASTQQLKALQEGLGAIRDVLLNGSQDIYLETYRQADYPQRQLSAKNAFLGSFPRFSLEALGMVAIAMLGALLVLQLGSGSALIPLLGAQALGAQRLLPALQQIYSGWALLNGFSAALEAVLRMLNQPLVLNARRIEPMLMSKDIQLRGVHFRFGPNQPDVLKGVNLAIRVGERIGVIGTTGSGKSTMVDILMGLLQPNTGKVLVDDVELHDVDHPERLASWWASIAHVPQNIYLADSSIAENIAFGILPEDIDMDRVHQAAEKSQIASFIETCSEGYKSFVGERGIRLSGGQRQRIGIARALYMKAQLLILDEATSALDTDTEQHVMSAVESLSDQLTIVIVAHRLSTVSQCHRVLKLEQGVVVANGPPEVVLKNNNGVN